MNIGTQMQRRLDFTTLRKNYLTHYLPEIDWQESVLPLVPIIQNSETWLVNDSFLPSCTMKDRATEVMVEWMRHNNISHFDLASTGNTAASLAWSMRELGWPKTARVYVSEFQHQHHSFKKPDSMTTYVLRQHNYEQAWNYCGSQAFLSQEIRKKIKEVRIVASGLSYLEGYVHLLNKGVIPTFICQSISAGIGLLGAKKVTDYLLKIGLIENHPRFLAAQPSAANPIARAYNAGAEAFTEEFYKNPRKSKAWAIRRGGAFKSYAAIKDLLGETNGIAHSVDEDEIDHAVNVMSKNGIPCGHTSAVAIASLNTLKEQGAISNNEIPLVLITGNDRKHGPCVIDYTL